MGMLSTPFPSDHLRMDNSAAEKLAAEKRAAEKLAVEKTAAARKLAAEKRESLRQQKFAAANCETCGVSGSTEKLRSKTYWEGGFPDRTEYYCSIHYPKSTPTPTPTPTGPT